MGLGEQVVPRTERETMKEVGILFQREMIQAYMAGRKRMTRRCRGLDEINKAPDDWCFLRSYYTGDQYEFHFMKTGGDELFVKCPYGIPGETTLWFRETWGTNSRWDDVKPSNLPVPPEIPPTIYYAADYDVNVRPERLDKWRPSIFLPREFSRHSSPLLKARVERLQDITEQDAKAEGVRQEEGGYWNYIAGEPFSGMTARQSFFSLWEDINGFDSLDANPWVGVYEFEPYRP